MGKRRRINVPTVRAGAFGGGLGLLVVAVGLLVIGIGWNGAAGAGGEVNGVPNLSAQLPWLLSGGILGLGLVVFGAALVIVHNQRVDRARLESKFDEVLEALTLNGTARGTAAVFTPSNAAGIFAAGATAYHRPDCRLVSGRTDVSYLTSAELATRDLTPCRVCKPEAVETLAN
jgi:hypothetical protein